MKSFVRTMHALAFRIFTVIIVGNRVNVTAKQKAVNKIGDAKYEELNEHTMVTDSNVFPYVAAILEGTTYLGAGALIDENWVLTAADGLITMQKPLRILRVRLGSINYKKGGSILPIKFFHIHPYFDDRKPTFDLALIMLSEPVRFTSSLKAIRLQAKPREIAATHFIVTSWSFSTSKEHYLESMEMIKRRRLLSVSHLHPSDPEDCIDELDELGVKNADAVMCLDPTVKSEPCLKDAGAPVVLNGVLWGIVSSWTPDNCNEDQSVSSFVTLVSPANISSWIHATVHGHRWTHNGDGKDE